MATKAKKPAISEALEEAMVILDGFPDGLEAACFSKEEIRAMRLAVSRGWISREDSLGSARYILRDFGRNAFEVDRGYPVNRGKRRGWISSTIASVAIVMAADLRGQAEDVRESGMQFCAGHAALLEDLAKIVDRFRADFQAILDRDRDSEM